MEQINLLGTQVRILVKPSKRARKTVKAEIKSENKIVVTTPLGFDFDVDTFLKKHKPHLEKKYKQFLTKKPILKDDSILYEGQYRRLIFEIVEKRSGKEVVLSEDKIRVFYEPKSNPYKILKNWMTQQARKRVEEVKQRYSGILENPLAIRVAETARWGYIRRNKVIIINWQIATLPPELSEYIIIHELTHLLEFNHQKRFHYKLSEIIPDYKKRERALQRYISIESKFEYRRIY